MSFKNYIGIFSSPQESEEVDKGKYYLCFMDVGKKMVDLLE